MKKVYLIPVFILLTSTCFAGNKKQKDEKENKISYNDYMMEYRGNDTASAIINIYFDERENAGVGKMSFLPITGALTIVSPPIGIGLSIVSAPLFINGLITYNKHSNKNLNKVLANYKDKGILSKSIRKKVGKQIEAERFLADEELKDKEFAALKLIRN